MEIVQSNSDLIIYGNKNLRIDKTLLKKDLCRELVWPSIGIYFNIVGTLKW